MCGPTGTATKDLQSQAQGCYCTYNGAPTSSGQYSKKNLTNYNTKNRLQNKKRLSITIYKRGRTDKITLLAKLKVQRNRGSDSGHVAIRRNQRGETRNASNNLGREHKGTHGSHAGQQTLLLKPSSSSTQCACAPVLESIQRPLFKDEQIISFPTDLALHLANIFCYLQ